MIESKRMRIDFFRILTGVLKYECDEPLNIILTFHSDRERDYISWGLEHNGHFSVQSLYNFLSFRGILEHHSLQIWSIPIPPKIRVFLCLFVKKQDTDKK